MGEVWADCEKRDGGFDIEGLIVTSALVGEDGLEVVRDREGIEVEKDRDMGPAFWLMDN